MKNFLAALMLFFAMSANAQPSTSINNLPPLTSNVLGTEAIPCSQGVATFKCTPNQITQGTSPTVNVLRFGADPTGVLDSSTAINVAAATVINGTNPAVYMPAGTYLVRNPIVLVSGQCLYGDGLTETVINVDQTFTPGQSGVILRNAPVKPFGFSCIHDFQIHGAQPQPVTSTASGNTPTGTSINVVKGSTYANSAGWYLVDFTTQGAVPVNTTIVSVVGNTVNVSQPVTGILNGDTLTAQISRANIVPLGVCEGVNLGCQYPPFIYLNVVGERPFIRDMLFWGCWDGIVVSTNTAPTIMDIKSGCVDIGLQIGDQVNGALGPKDFVFVRGWHHWNGWGWNSGSAPFAKGNSAWDDGTTRCMEIGRGDGLNLSQIGCVMSRFHLNSAHGSSVSPSQFSNIMLDGLTSFLVIDNSLMDIFTGVYSGASNTGIPGDGSSCPITVNNGNVAMSNIWEVSSTPDVTSEVCVNGGNLRINQDRFQVTNTTVSPITVNGGTLDISGARFTYHTGTTLTVPTFNIISGNYVITNNEATGLVGGTWINTAVDNANSFVSGNAFIGATAILPRNGAVAVVGDYNINQQGILCQSASQTPITHTGDTNETNLATCAIPANTLAATGSLRICGYWYRNAVTTNSVGFNVRLASNSGAVSGGANNSTGDSVSGDVAYRSCTRIYNAGSTGNQLVMLPLTSESGGGTSSAPSTPSFSSSTATLYLNFNCTLNTSSADTCGIYAYSVEYLNP